MRKNYFTWILLSVLILSCSEEPSQETGLTFIEDYEVKASSFNIRFDNPDDGPNNWHNRKEHVVAFVRDRSIEIVGMQEVLNNQFEYLKTELPQYSAVGVGRDDGISQGEYAPIFFKTDLFELIDSGTFWLSETPETPSIGWDAVIKRICTYAILKDLRNDREIHFYNTHFDHVGDQARIESAKLITERIQSNSAGEWVILTGDLNVEPGTPPYATIADAGLSDAFFSNESEGPVGTWNGFQNSSAYNRRIDYVFSNGFASLYYLTSDETYVSGRFLSDHFPVVVTYEFRPL
jgi:endonuclease/exonuclease/phosphatase family metal-dependent hydrolase